MIYLSVVGFVSLYVCADSDVWLPPPPTAFLSPVSFGSSYVSCPCVQPKTPPQPAAQFTKKQEAQLEDGRAPVCYFCKGDVDDADTDEGAFIRVRERGRGGV